MLEGVVWVEGVGGVRVCGVRGEGVVLGRGEDVCGREWCVWEGMVWKGSIRELLISRHKWTPYQPSFSYQAAGTTCTCVNCNT